MKSTVYTFCALLILSSALLFVTGCEPKKKQSLALKSETALAENNTMVSDSRDLPNGFKEYWYAGEAEITSYKLEQARYGELREGHAVLVYVTEPFRPGKQVKADDNQPDNLSVLKLNSTKKFLTGIYPYSIMTSTFYPVTQKRQAVKVSFSAQEWCGHVYSQLNNREQFEINSHSYFEEEADQKLLLDKTLLEDEIWTQLRLNPSELPTGSIAMIPSFEYIRLGHKPIKAYPATATLSSQGALSTYEISYPELERSLRIQFETGFPYAIDNWTETHKSGFGANAQTMSSSGKKMNTIKSAYWQKNGNKDVILRDSLGL